MAVLGFIGRYGTNIGLLTSDGAEHPATRPGPAATNPSYLALSSGGEVLYAALEIEEGGAVSAYSLDGDELRLLGAQPTGGAAACHVSVDSSGRYVLTANYGSGSVAVHPINADGGMGERSDLVQHEGSGPNQERQSGPHAHMVVPDPSGEYVLAVDLGTDTVYQYHLEDGRLRPSGAASGPPGAGARHLAFHPGGRFAYVVNELASTVCTLDLAAFEIGGSTPTVASDVAAMSRPSAIRVSADGRYCYVANRGPDTLAVLAVSPDGEALQLIATVPTGGAHPRDFVLESDLIYVANQHSDTITMLRVDHATGVPEPTGVALSTPSPSCLVLR